MAWPERLLFPIPDQVDHQASALLEPLGVALHALDVGNASTGMTAGVFGCGPIGLLIVQLLAMIDARTIIATDSLRHRVAAASAMGATHAMPPRSLDRSAIDGLTEGHGVDVAFEAAGDDASVTDAMDAVRPGGRVVLVGIPADDRTSFVASTARRKGLTISMSRRMKPTDLPRAIHLAASGRLQLGRMVTERHDLSDGVQAFASLCERRGLKVVVEP
jgi:L-iditol 2-dehydrogenase